jgi:rubrerythrin
MAKLKGKEDFLGFLYCSSVLEEKTSLLYGNLAEKTRLPLVKALLLNIAYDSGKHSAILQGIVKSIGRPKVKAEDCEKRLGETWRTISVLSQELALRKRVPNDDLPPIMEKLKLLESTLGEEYYILVQLKTLQFMTKEIRQLYNVDLEDLKDILETMIKDEERHNELLATIRKILGPPEQKQADNTPLVRYQNPNSWVSPYG